MKPWEKIASIIIIVITVLIVSVIGFQLLTKDGCGCVPRAPDIFVEKMNNSTGSYYNITCIDYGGFNKATDLDVYSVPSNYDFSTSLASSGQLAYHVPVPVPGSSYYFKINDTEPNRYVATVKGDDGEVIIFFDTVEGTSGQSK